MKWLGSLLWRRKRETAASIRAAREARERIRVQQGEVDELTRELAARHEHNSFRRAIENAFRGQTHA